ncbi:hypothetical protein ACE10Z_15560 [Bradyrhizobium sp. Pha-3]
MPWKFSTEAPFRFRPIEVDGNGFVREDVADKKAAKIAGAVPAIEVQSAR